ncbi:uncharacterized protein [Onthophagus taurus]|uniref:uncharacterized protein n=1 Tax=Onthophagus taurus TaxID=166361 RepID=UPI000C1FE153|nr:uncharacterized protein LOC111417048 [Onthophagus taurus]
MHNSDSAGVAELLEVRGKRVTNPTRSNVFSGSGPLRFSLKRLNESPQLLESKSESSISSKHENAEGNVRLNVVNLTSENFACKKIREIREAEDVKALKKLFDSIGNINIDNNKNRGKARLGKVTSIDVDEVYEAFYGRYYNHLREIISRD